MIRTVNLLLIVQIILTVNLFYTYLVYYIFKSVVFFFPNCNMYNMELERDVGDGT
jgi:hypothetical protein